jgi:hypothetical protein
MATSIGSSWSLESLRGEKGMKPMPIEGSAGSTVAERATTWWAGSRTVLKVGFVLLGVLVIVGASLGIVAATGGFASSPSSPSSPVYAMGMRPKGIKKSGTAGRRMEETDPSNLYTEFTCTDASMIGDLSVSFMAVGIPGFDTDAPMIFWDWKKSNADGDMYNFDDPRILMQAGANDLILNSNSPINSQDELVKEMSYMFSSSRPDSSTGLMGCTSLEEYASNGNEYVCGPYSIAIVYMNISAGTQHSETFPIFPVLSEFIAGNYTRGVLDFNATIEDTGCEMHARFDTYNPNGNNSIPYTRQVSKDVDTNPPATHNADYKYDVRFPGQGWSFDTGKWTRPNYTTHRDFFDGVEGPSGSREFSNLTKSVIERIATGNMKVEERDAILDAWNPGWMYEGQYTPPDGNETITPGVQIMYKLYIESYGSLFQNWMQHYLKGFMTRYRKNGLIASKPKNIPDELWGPP